MVGSSLLLSATVWLIVFLALAIGGIRLARVRRRLHVTQEALQIDIDDRRRMEIALRTTSESLTIAQASADVATFDIDVVRRPRYACFCVPHRAEDWEASVDISQ
jgi:hypothetical protein